ncbi:MAG: hypothetical protein ACREJC_05145 [Tepidisphaeraceae bacterium]
MRYDILDHSQKSGNRPPDQPVTSSKDLPANTSDEFGSLMIALTHEPGVLINLTTAPTPMLHAIVTARGLGLIDVLAVSQRDVIGVRLSEDTRVLVIDERETV